MQPSAAERDYPPERVGMEVRKIISRKAVAAAGAAATVTGALLLVTAAAASASVSPLQVTLSASPGDGASATCSSSGDIVLTTGSDASTTYAEADVNGVAGKNLFLSSEPKFVTDHYNAGSPRWVIELNNGHSLWGYPGLDLSGQTAPDANGMAWAVDNGNTYTDWATAYAGASGATTTIKDAFIVADGDQLSTTDTISGATFNGQPLSCEAPAPAPSTTPTPTPSPSSSHAGFPTGGVQTGGGKPATSPWLPFGIAVTVAGLLALAGGVLALRRQRA